MLDFNQLSPRYFARGREFDPAAFAVYKQAAAAHAAVAIWTYILWGIGLLLLILFRDIIGLVAFFGCMGAALAIVTPKYQSLKKSWDRLGISRNEANLGLVNARKGVYAWDGEVADYAPAGSTDTVAPATAGAAPAAPLMNAVHYPLRAAYLALYILGGLAALLLLLDFLTGHSLYLYSYVPKLMIAAYGVALVPLLSNEAKQRCAGLLVLAVGLLLQYVAANALLPEQMLYFYRPYMLFAYSFVLIEVAGVAALLWGRQRFRDLHGREKLLRMALWYCVAAGAMTLIYILAFGLGCHFLASSDSGTISRFLISNILSVFFSGAIVLGVYWLTRWLLEDCHRYIQLGLGAKIWCWICITATSASVVFLIIRSLRYGNAQYTDPLAALIGVVGFILLLRREKAGFMVILASIGTAFLYSAPHYLCYNFGYFLSSLLMLLNPLITWLIIRGAWQAGNTAATAASAANYYAPPILATAGRQPTSPLREAILAELARRQPQADAGAGAPQHEQQ